MSRASADVKRTRSALHTLGLYVCDSVRGHWLVEDPSQGVHPNSVAISRMCEADGYFRIMPNATKPAPRSKSAATTPASAEQRIAKLISRFDPQDQKLLQAARKALRKRFPTANELVYDYARNFVIGYSPTEAGGQGIAALSLEPDGVRFYLTQGAKLPDPHKLLQGKAGARYITLSSAKDLLRPEVEALRKAAEKIATVPLKSTGRGELIMKDSASGKKSGKPAKR